MCSGMKAFATALIIGLLIGLSGPVSTWAANPLTPAEQRVCRSLKHCLNIVETHPYDAFDYKVLAWEFRQFGTKGRNALIRRIGKPGHGAGNAADVLALMQDQSALPKLTKLAETGSEKARTLAGRAHNAIWRRLQPHKEWSLIKSAPKADIEVNGLVCAMGDEIAAASRKREMPFFETSVSEPDEYGVYRPSAVFQIPLRNISRGFLKSAHPIKGGWIAGYMGGLLYYDNEAGAPKALSQHPVLAVLPREPSSINQELWAISETPNDLVMGTASSEGLTPVANLSGVQIMIRKTQDGTLIIISDTGDVMQLSPDGRATSGCPKLAIQ